MQTFHDVFLHMLMDLYDAEKKLTKALPKMIKKASTPELRQALEEHLHQTEDQVTRLEEAFELVGEKPKAVACDGIKGIIAEADHMLKEKKLKGAVRDAAIIAAAQKAEHYEISAYGSARAFAEKMGHKVTARLLQQTLDEESDANEKLNTIALDKVNDEAMALASGM